ncbi:transposase [Parafrankia sp. EUN1f]|uniref:transposase n=1 Tax=Parafrankia sp. EUN1f TaxID=102897 RepID=UPI0012F91F22
MGCIGASAASEADRKGQSRPATWTRPRLIDGIRWRTPTGTPWQNAPAQHRHWRTKDGLFRDWQRDGTWKAGADRLAGAGGRRGLITWEVSADSMAARAHQ